MLFARNFYGGGESECTYTDASNVRLGADRGDGTIGTLELPAESVVKDGELYGADGIEFEGTLIGGDGVTVITSPQLAANGKTISIFKGDDYTGTRKLPIEIVSQTDLTNQFMVIALYRNGTPGFSFRGKAYTVDEKQFFDVEMTKEQSSKFAPGDWQYIVRIEAAIDQESQISRGTWQVNGFTTPSPILGTSRP